MKLYPGIKASGYHTGWKNCQIIKERRKRRAEMYRFFETLFTLLVLLAFGSVLIVTFVAFGVTALESSPWW